MLSNTTGLQHYSRVLAFRQDDLTSLDRPCPTLKKKGSCPSFKKETAIRTQIAHEKESELRGKATTLYNLQLELMADGDASSAAAACGATFSTDPAQKGAVIRRLVQELKEEPEYVHWNLEAAVAERMVERRVRRCPYTHRVEVQKVLKRERHNKANEEERLRHRQRVEEESVSCDQQTREITEEQRPPTTARHPSTSATASIAAWRAERARVFANFTPFQRCVVCLLWQQEFVIPQRVICNVRKKLENEAEEAAFKGVAPDGKVDEEALEDYIASSAFQEKCEVEEKRLVSRTTCRPSLGVFDLSFLPQVISFVSQNPRASVVTQRTRDYFGIEAPLAPARLTEKELDLSGTARAGELVEALEWLLYVYRQESKFQSNMRPEGQRPNRPTESVDKAAHTVLLHRAGHVVLRSLTLQHCNLTNAEGLVTSLHKRNFASTLLSLDLSHNRLSSLRFLFLLRAHFSERLLRLSLADNLITKKPEYQEQVRRSLPKLTSLDGEPIRRPPLELPRPLPLSSSLCPGDLAGVGASALSGSELAMVMDCVTRLCYIWETRRIPHTQLERQAFLQEGNACGARASSAIEANAPEVRLPPEPDMDEDNFPHRYLHPSATFSFTQHPNLIFYKAATMQNKSHVELDENYQGMRLNPGDVRDLRVFDVAMRNASRDLLAGRSVLQRFARGAENCYLAYQLSLYPDQMDVCHHLGGAIVSIVKISSTKSDPASLRTTERGKQGQARKAAAPLTVFAATGTMPDVYVVTLHGVMTWRLPSMRRSECLMAAYDRVLTLVPKPLPAVNRAWERRRSPKLVLYNDQVHLRPFSQGDNVCYESQTHARVAHLVVQFGLEACKDGVALVVAVMERSTSDAAESVALDALVFGPPPAPVSPEGGEPEEESELRKKARVGLTRLLSHFQKHATKPLTEVPQDGCRVLRIFSLLSRSDCSNEECDTSGVRTKRDPRTKRLQSWGTELHTVTFGLIDEVTHIANQHYTRQLVRPPPPPPNGMKRLNEESLLTP